MAGGQALPWPGIRLGLGDACAATASQITASLRKLRQPAGRPRLILRPAPGDLKKRRSGVNVRLCPVVLLVTVAYLEGHDTMEDPVTIRTRTRPASVPSYYLGRPASFWISLTSSPRCGRNAPAAAGRR
jgi:hypothetical protein